MTARGSKAARPTRALLALGLAAGGALIGAPAHAEGPVTLDDDFVLDAADVLAPADEQEAQTRLARLSADTGYELWVVYVDTFENPAAADQWANLSAEANGLGVDQYLLAVAVEDRNYYLSAATEGPVSEQRIAEIESRVQPFLSSQDWLGAVDAAADGFDGSGGGGTSGGSALPWVIGGVAAVGGTAWYLASRRRRSGATVGPAGPGDGPERTTEDLARDAATALVATDDAVRASEQELGFAIAQFGREATGEFEKALQDAKAGLARAFELKQRLDDHEPDAEQDVRAWNAEIVRLCEAAAATLQEKQAAFGELRRIEQDAPTALADAQRRRGTADGVPERVEAAVGELAARYAPDAIATVADNAAQARARLAFADEQLARAQQLVGAGDGGAGDGGAGDGGAAAVAIRSAEQAVAQALQLEKAATDLGATLVAAEKQAVALVDDLEQDLARARTLPASADVAAAITATEQAVARAKQNLAGPARSPQGLLEALEAANAHIDGVVASARRAQHLLGQTLLQARSQVSGAEEYIAARRGAVGAGARTRLAEAGAELARAEALQTGDPAQALQRAQRALQLAAESARLAQADVGSADWGGGLGGGVLGGGMGGMLGGRPGGGMVDGLVGGLLGGLISGGLGGGSRGGSSGWGGGSIPGGGLGGGRARRGGSGFGGVRGRRGGGRF